MAPVNPAIQPTNDPSYGSSSRAVNVPDTIKVRGVENNTILPEGVKQGDTSAQYLGQADAYASQAEAVGVKGYGDLFAGIAQTADFLGKAGVSMVQKDIEDRVYSTANEIRQAYTAKLEELKQNPAGIKGVLDATNGGETQSPDEIQGLGDNLISLRGAKDAGKISNTYYQGRLLAEAKDLRARYPGFRQEIDQEFAKVTGTNPANAYVNSLVGDINKAAAAAGGDQKKYENYILNNLGFPNSQQIMSDFKAGKITGQDVVQWAAPYEQQKVVLQNRALQFNDNKLDRGEKEYKAGKAVDTYIGSTINQAADGLLGQLGITDEASTAAVAGKLAANDPVTKKNWEQVGQNIANMKVKLQLNILRTADGTGATGALAGGKEEIIKRYQAASSILDAMQDRVYNKDAGGLFSVARSTKEQTDNDTADLLKDSKVGPVYRQVNIMKGFGEQFMAKFNLDQISGDVPKQYSNYVTRWKQGLITQSEYGPTGQPITLNDAFDDMSKKKVVDPKVSSTVINEVTRITDKNTPDDAKVNLAIAAFSPGNRGFISRLNADGVDPKGRQIQGQNAVFQKFTTPEITKEMARLGKDNPQVWDNYVNWTKETFGKELLNREINNLKDFGSNPNLKISWDSDNKRFGVEYNSGFREGMTSRQGLGSGVPNADPQYNLAVTSINRINSNLSNFKNVAEASGQDVDAFLLRTIRDTAGPDSLSNVSGIPAQMLQQIDLTRSFSNRFKGK